MFTGWKKLPENFALQSELSREMVIAGFLFWPPAEPSLLAAGSALGEKGDGPL